MLIKVTNTCTRGCSHCLENSTGKVAHMTRLTFTRALAFTAAIERLAREQTGYPFLLLSGGECTDHPDLLDMVSEAEAAGFLPVLLSHGLWINDPARADFQAQLLRPGRHLSVQVTNDPRYYPQNRKPGELPDDPRVIPIDRIGGSLLPLGRATGVDTEKKSPSSFNFRSLVRHSGSVELALVGLRARAMAGKAGHCSPTISHEGTLVAGESRFCHAVGDVAMPPTRATFAMITKNIAKMSCDNCGLLKNLTVDQADAVGMGASWRTQQARLGAWP